MKTPALLRTLSRLKPLSPAGLVARAGLLAAFYLVCKISGLRGYTTFLSGTSQSATWSGTVFGGVTYLAAYFGAVLGAPVLLLTAGLLAGWRRLRAGRAPACKRPPTGYAHP